MRGWQEWIDKCGEREKGTEMEGEMLGSKLAHFTAGTTPVLVRIILQTSS